MISNTLSNKEVEINRAVKENCEAVEGLLRCLQGYGKNGERKIALLIKELGDGKSDSCGV